MDQREDDPTYNRFMKLFAIAATKFFHDEFGLPTPGLREQITRHINNIAKRKEMYTDR